MLEGLVAAGFYSCFYGNGRRAVLVGAGTAGITLGAFLLPEIQSAVPILTTLWIMLAGFFFQTKQREQVLLSGGIWLMAHSLGVLLTGGTPLQTVIMTALLLIGILYILGRARLHLLWMAALVALWLLTGFLESIAYTELWQRRVMAVSLYTVASGFLIFQQLSCSRQELGRIQWGDHGKQGSAAPHSGAENWRSNTVPHNGTENLQSNVGFHNKTGNWRESAEQEYRQLRIFEHDFRHHLDMVAALYEESGASEAKAYIEDLKQARVSRQGLKYGGEKELVYIMLAKKEACRQAQISFSYQIVGTPRGIAQMDMTALLLNLLDNAIRACKEVPEPRSIGLMLLSRGELWEIEMVNSGQYEPEGERMDIGASFRTKNGAKRKTHGIGMVSVKQIVEKYHGTYQIWQEEGQVRQKMILVQCHSAETFSKSETAE